MADSKDQDSTRPRLRSEALSEVAEQARLLVRIAEARLADPSYSGWDGNRLTGGDLGHIRDALELANAALLGESDELAEVVRPRLPKQSKQWLTAKVTGTVRQGLEVIGRPEAKRGELSTSDIANLARFLTDTLPWAEVAPSSDQPAPSFRLPSDDRERWEAILGCIQHGPVHQGGHDDDLAEIQQRARERSAFTRGGAASIAGELLRRFGAARTDPKTIKKNERRAKTHPK